MAKEDPHTQNQQGHSENRTEDNQAEMSESGAVIDGLTDILSQESDSGTTDSYIRTIIEPNDHLESKPLEVFLRYEEDLATAYRDYYKDQVVSDKRNELGRFLFGVSATTLGFLISVFKLSTPQPIIDGYELIWLGISGMLLLLSLLCSLRLAVPKNQDVDPKTLELVGFHRVNSNELSRLSFTWFALWIGGLVLGLFLIIN